MKDVDSGMVGGRQRGRCSGHRCRREALVVDLSLGLLVTCVHTDALPVTIDAPLRTTLSIPVRRETRGTAEVAGAGGGTNVHPGPARTAVHVLAGTALAASGWAGRWQSF